MAEPIKIPFWLRTQVGPGNHVLDAVQISHGKGQFRGGNGLPIVKYRDTLQSSVQKLAEPIEMPFALWARRGPRNRAIWGSRSPMGKGNFGGSSTCCIEFLP